MLKEVIFARMALSERRKNQQLLNIEMRDDHRLSQLLRSLAGDTNDNIVRHVGARGVMVIVVGNGHGDPSSNPGQG